MQLNTQIETKTDAVEKPFPQTEHRARWLEKRIRLEKGKFSSHVRGYRRRSRWELMRFLTGILELVLRLTFLLGKAKAHALKIEYREVDIPHPKVPKSLDGFRILHLSDLHIDRMPEVIPRIVESVKGQSYDLLVITGDFREEHNVSPQHLAPALTLLRKSIQTKYGAYAILGNHDGHDFPQELERIGYQVLLNESTSIPGTPITLTGTDDVHYFYTPEASLALAQSPNDGFKIALVHSAEMCQKANEQGYSLYLCGHTHGGQICLPGGFPIFTRHHEPRSRAKGLWRVDKLVGYTNSGAGVVALAARLHCPGEAACLILRSISSR